MREKSLKILKEIQTPWLRAHVRFMCLASSSFVQPEIPSNWQPRYNKKKSKNYYNRMWKMLVANWLILLTDKINKSYAVHNETARKCYKTRDRCAAKGCARIKNINIDKKKGFGNAVSSRAKSSNRLRHSVVLIRVVIITLCVKLSLFSFTDRQQADGKRGRRRPAESAQR